MDAYLGEIRMFGGNFAPQGWAMCDGSLLAISSYNALFSLLGTAYGGNGTTNFGLPDLRGRVAIGQGSGPGLTPRVLAQHMGTESETLTASQIPSHNHLLSVGAVVGSTDPTNNYPGVMVTGTGTRYYKMPTPPPTPPPASGVMAATVVSGGGANVGHVNMMPSMAISYIICVEGGIYPTAQ